MGYIGDPKLRATVLGLLIIRSKIVWDLVWDLDFGPSSQLAFEP